MVIETALQVVQQSPFLDALPRSDQVALCRLLGQPSFFAAGAPIVREGEPADRWFVIAEGAAAVERTNLIGEIVHLAELTRGDSFGESALLPAEHRQATVRARTPVTAYALDRAALGR